MSVAGSRGALGAALWIGPRALAEIGYHGVGKEPELDGVGVGLMNHGDTEAQRSTKDLIIITSFFPLCLCASVVHNQPMPERSDIGSILVIGPGAIVTGDAGRMAVG
jgi:hypothetical protein